MGALWIILLCSKLQQINFLITSAILLIFCRLCSEVSIKEGTSTMYIGNLQFSAYQNTIDNSYQHVQNNCSAAIHYQFFYVRILCHFYTTFIVRISFYEISIKRRQQLCHCQIQYLQFIKLSKASIYV